MWLGEPQNPYGSDKSSCKCTKKVRVNYWCVKRGTLLLPCKVKSSVYLIRYALWHKDVWESGGIAPPFLTSAIDGGEWSASCPCRLGTARGDGPQYPLDTGGPQSLWSYSLRARSVPRITRWWTLHSMSWLSPDISRVLSHFLPAMYFLFQQLAQCKWMERFWTYPQSSAKCAGTCYGPRQRHWLRAGRPPFDSLKGTRVFLSVTLRFSLSCPFCG
jgi:hypothetical protein